MINPMSPMRRHTRFPVSWRVVYGNDEFLAEGTVLDLTARGWRVAGSMPVVPGIQLKLQVAVPEKLEPLRVQRATVLWVKDLEFAIEAHEMTAIDHAWVTEFLREKLGLMWMAPLTGQESPRQGRDKTPGDTTHPQPSIISRADILRQVLAMNTAATNVRFETGWDDDSELQEGEANAPCDHLPPITWLQAHRIVRGMLAMKEARARTGRDLIDDN